MRVKLGLCSDGSPVPSSGAGGKRRSFPRIACFIMTPRTGFLVEKVGSLSQSATKIQKMDYLRHERGYDIKKILGSSIHLSLLQVIKND